MTPGSVRTNNMRKRETKKERHAHIQNDNNRNKRRGQDKRAEKYLFPGSETKNK